MISKPITATITHIYIHRHWFFRNNIRSCVENECCCPCTVDTTNVNFTSKIYIPSVQTRVGYIHNHDNDSLWKSPMWLVLEDRAFDDIYRLLYFMKCFHCLPRHLIQIGLIVVWGPSQLLHKSKKIPWKLKQYEACYLKEHQRLCECAIGWTVQQGQVISFSWYKRQWCCTI